MCVRARLVAGSFFGDVGEESRRSGRFWRRLRCPVHFWGCAAGALVGALVIALVRNCLHVSVEVSMWAVEWR